MVAVPHELFMVVVRETASEPEVLAFVFPNHQIVESGLEVYLSSVSEIEEKTGLMNPLPDGIKSVAEEVLW